jgi:hypothetical protein
MEYTEGCADRLPLDRLGALSSSNGRAGSYMTDRFAHFAPFCGQTDRRRGAPLTSF